MAYKTLSIIAEEQHAGRVDLVVRDLTELSRSQARGIIDHDCVTINGEPCKNAADEVAVNNVVEVCYDPHTRYKEKKRSWDDRTFDIVAEDKHLIVVNKAAGTLSVPTDNEERNTLVDRVSVYLNHSKRDKMAYVAHRLDRDVSGLLVFAKHEDVGKALTEQFKVKRPDHIYNAIVAGVVEKDESSFTSHLTVGKNMSVYSAPPSRHSEEATTHYRVLRRGVDTTLIEARMESGKRNQIRVHFSEVGHPVLGDQRYKPKEATHSRWIRRRIALHAKTLSFVHPITREVVTYDSDLPSPMQKFIAGSKKHDPTKVAKSPWAAK